MRYILFLSLFLAMPAWAGEPAKGTRVSISASAEMTLPNDEVVVHYRIEASGSHADALRKKVNRISQNIHLRLKKETGVKQQTLSRRMEIIWRYDKVSRKQVRDGWRLLQREQVTSQKLDVAPLWIDAIEKTGAHLDQLRFRISDKSSKTAQKILRLQAVKRFREQASTMAKALDATSFRILNLQTNNRQPVYPVRAEMAMMKTAADAAPSLQAGEGKISVAVSGTILLPEKAFSVN